MAKTSRERVADYRRRRRDEGLCLEAGCQRDPKGRARCAPCRDRLAWGERQRRDEGLKTGKDRTIERLRAESTRVREHLEQAKADHRQLLARFEQLDAPPTSVDLSDDVLDELATFDPDELVAWVKVTRALAKKDHDTPAANAVRWVTGNKRHGAPYSDVSAPRRP